MLTYSRTCSNLTGGRGLSSWPQKTAQIPSCCIYQNYWHLLCWPPLLLEQINVWQSLGALGTKHAALLAERA